MVVFQNLQFVDVDNYQQNLNQENSYPYLVILVQMRPISYHVVDQFHSEKRPQNLDSIYAFRQMKNSNRCYSAKKLQLKVFILCNPFLCATRSALQNECCCIHLMFCIIRCDIWCTSTNTNYRTKFVEYIFLYKQIVGQSYI